MKRRRKHREKVQDWNGFCLKKFIK